MVTAVMLGVVRGGPTAPILRVLWYLELLGAKHVWGGGGQHLLPNPSLLVDVHGTDGVVGEELIVDPPCLLGQLEGSRGSG